MKLLWMTWKDRRNPFAGGAETVNEELAKRLVRDGHEVLFLVAGFQGGASEESRDGFRIVRLGTRWSVYWHTFRYYRKYLRGWADVVIDEMNTVPFFARFFVRERVVLFVHQLCREIWFYEMPFPVALLGYLLEPLYLWALSGSDVITVSESTKDDLLRYRFRADRIHIISEGIDLTPIAALDEKPDQPTILSFGALRAMKRPDHVIRAFEIAKKSSPRLRLIVAGAPQGEFGIKFLEMIKSSPYRDDIEYVGAVTDRSALYRRAHLLCVTSVKEGWALTVTEAQSQGTPAVVYDVDGLRNSVGSGGVIAGTTPAELAEGIVDTLRAPERYDAMRRDGLVQARRYTFGESYRQFKTCLLPR